MSFVKIPKNNIQSWTIQAKYCYDRGCNCFGCDIADIVETKCLMKKTVIELVKNLGKPPEEYSRKFCETKEPDLTKDFILNQLHQGKTLKQIAKETGFPESTVGYWSKYIYSINAKYERKQNHG